MLTPTRGVEAMTDEVLRLRDDARLRSMVETRIAEFLEVKEMDTEKWFEELAYCLLTAYSSARLGQLCVDALCDRNALLQGDLDQVVETLRTQGHRFAEKRAEYIFNARELAPTLKGTIQGFKDIKAAREWLAKNVKGIGFKESSHFLRNVGYLDVAIIDRHIISNMVDHGILEERPKSITKRRYLEYEHILAEVARRVGMTLGEMDLYLWYRKTGKVLK
ncbi:MAG: N-glycosylase/DNA lyase [Candidatus Bathyarchaeia archaeon]